MHHVDYTIPPNTMAHTRIVPLMVTGSLTFAVMAPGAAAFSFPQPQGYVTDAAGVLTAQQERMLERQLKGNEKRTEDEVAVLLVRTTDGGNVVKAAQDVGNAWGVGKKTENNGVVIFLSVNEGAVAMFPGPGLEPFLPKDTLQNILERQMIPRLKRGMFFQGLRKGIRALEKQIADARGRAAEGGSEEGSG
ncbi:MAG: TPM domain-containing protein [Candidatus Peribacteraceae bacterium]|jgi:uncharacterized protein